MQVTISVINTNEHRPVCLQPHSTFFVPNYLPARQSFGQILATDEDINDVVTYNTDNGNYHYNRKWRLLRKHVGLVSPFYVLKLL